MSPPILHLFSKHYSVPSMGQKLQSSRNMVATKAPDHRIYILTRKGLWQGGHLSWEMKEGKKCVWWPTKREAFADEGCLVKRHVWRGARNHDLYVGPVPTVWNDINKVVNIYANTTLCDFYYWELFPVKIIYEWLIAFWNLPNSLKWMFSTFVTYFIRSY